MDTTIAARLNFCCWRRGPLVGRIRSLFLIAVAMISANTRLAGEWQNSLKPKGEPATQLVLVQDGRPLVGILCTENPTVLDRKAAQELQMWIKEITGATLEISYGGARGRNILIRTDSRLGEDGYSILVRNNQVLLWGGQARGLMNGVYAMLEEDLGCRFYTRDSIRLQKTNTLVLAPVERRFIPKLKLRDPFYACAFDPAWSLRNRTSAPRANVPEEQGGHMDYDGMFVHTAAQIVPPEKFFKSHPEYFAQLSSGERTSSQLCATDAEVANLAIAYVRETLNENPNTEIVSVSKNDNTQVCHCQRCEKLRAEEGSDMANQLILVNRVAEAVERDYPNATIDTLAYLETTPVPKTIRPRKNVAIRLCSDTRGAWRHPFTPAERCPIAKLVSAWSAIHNRIYIWDYTVNFSHYLAPMPNLDVMAANIRFWVTNHAEGVMLQGGYQGVSERDELKCWVTSKLLWNPEWDEKALIRDFMWGHYGGAAPALLEYESLLEQMRREFAQQMEAPAQGIRFPMNSAFLSKSFIDRATQIFARARELAKDDKSLQRRVARAELPILYLKCNRFDDLGTNDFSEALRTFERIGRQENVQYLREGGADFESALVDFKSHSSKPAPQK
jgi:hypothetical protein